jgi:hypothetical protein
LISNLILIASGLSFAAQPGCESCHPEIAKSFARTGMGRSVGLPTAATARFSHKASQSQLSIKGNVHRIEHDGLSAEYPVALRIGSGKVGSSFGVLIDGKWFQSPISWYAQARAFRMSPGYEQEKYPDFDRPIRSECLYCHAGNAAAQVAAIGCDRCHGEGTQHSTNPSRQNIINPAKLTGVRRDSVCEQCHLPGVARVLNPGKHAADYSPGEVPEDTWTTFVAGSDFKVASHVEQLAQSRCLQRSESKLWCGSCHSPHPTKARPEPVVDAVCQSCHQPHDNGRDRCATCHMPQRGAQDVAHVAYTDHRIQTPGKTTPVKPRGLLPWRRVDRFEQRNRGLALFEWGTTVRDVDTLQEAFRILIDLTPEEKDASVLSALGNIAIQKGRPAEAKTWLTEAARLEPNSAEARMRLGRAEQANGKSTDALQHYEEAIRLDPVYFDAYVLAAQIHRAAGGRQAYRRVLQQYLRHVPGSLAARKALAAAP